MRRSHGVPSLAAIVIEQAIHDYTFAPRETAAYRTAHKFLSGGVCSHVVCRRCVKGDSWRTGECPPADGTVPCTCGHSWHDHIVMEFDWTDHRDTIAGAAGLEPDALGGMVKEER